MSTLQPRLTALASTLAAGSALASAAMIGGVPTAPIHSSPLFDTVQRNVGLVATDLSAVNDNLWTNPQLVLNTTTFAGSLQWLMDNLLGIGNATLPKMLDPGGKVTVESLLAGSHLGVSSTMTDVFNGLGLNNFKMGEVFKDLGLPTSTTLDDLIGKLPAADQTVNGLMGALTGNALGENTTLVHVVDILGMGGKSISDLMTMVGFPGTTTVDGLLGQLGMGELGGLLGAMGVTSTTDLTNLITMLGSNAGGLTLDQLMDPASANPTIHGAGTLSSIGDYTLGSLLGFKTSTTMSSILDGMHWTTSGTTQTLGGLNIGDIVGLVKITPSMTLATLLGDLPLGVGSHTNLGTDTLAELLHTMTITTTDPTGATVDATTTVSTLLTDMGLGSLSLDALIGLPT